MSIRDFIISIIETEPKNFLFFELQLPLSKINELFAHEILDGLHTYARKLTPKQREEIIKLWYTHYKELT